MLIDIVKLTKKIYKFLDIYRLLVIGVLILSSSLNGQITLTLNYSVKSGTPDPVKSGEYWTMQLEYSISSTTAPDVSDVKIEIPLPDYIQNAQGMVGTSHAPLSNFVFSGTPGSKKMTISFINPVPTGSNGVLEFRMRTMNGSTPNNTAINTCATLSDGFGNNSGAICANVNISAKSGLCGLKTLKSGGGLGTPTVYKIALAYNTSYLNLAPFGVLNASNISITDTYPLGATYIGAKVIDKSGNTVPSMITQNGNSITATIPDYIVGYTTDWSIDTYTLEIELQYDSPPFNTGQSVTNTATATLTPLGESPITIIDGSSSGIEYCVSDLTETHTLQTSQIEANLTKVRTCCGYPANIYSGQELAYNFNFTNSGSIPITNGEIIENIPDDLIYNSMRLDSYGSIITGVQYQTNLNSTWTNWPGIGPTRSQSQPPLLSSGEKLTKIKFILITPFNSLASLVGTHTIFFNAGTVTSPTPISNCLEWTASNNGLPPNRITCNNEYTINPPATTAKLQYSASHSPACQSPYTVGSQITISGTITASTGYSDVQNPVFGFYVQSGAQFVTGSQLFNALGSGLPTPTFNIIPNHLTYSGKSYDLLKWSFPTGTIFPVGTSASISANVIFTNTIIPDDPIQLWLIADGSNVSEYAPSTGASPAPFPDISDWDSDGNSTELVKAAPTSFNSCTAKTAASAEMESIKWVKGLCDTNYSRYPDFGQTVPGGDADYMLIVTNKGNIPMSNLVIIDILPFIGDEGVVTFTPRSTQWRPNLAGPISGTSGTVYYSTSGNPCRPELGITAPGCTPANWTTTPPADITQVQSVKFDFGTNIIQPNQSFQFNWPMRAPVNAPTNNEIAWNSFGFTATRTDNNTPLLAAEPPKVGIKVKAGAPAYYGNYVWFDTNKNGIQEVGENGVDGIQVTLYKTTSTTPNPASDQLVNYTVTGNGGLYRFSNLQPGNYYAVFNVAGYTTSPKNAIGSDNTNDSDGMLFGGYFLTEVTTLDANEDDPTWDQGIYIGTGCDVQASCTKSDNSNCLSPNGSATVTTNANQILWSNGNTTATINGLSAGTYTVTVTNTNDGCTSTCQVQIINTLSGPTAQCSSTSNSNCITPNGTATVTTDGDQILWSTGSTSATITGLSGGTYTVTVTNTTTGCTNTCSSIITTSATLPSAQCSSTNNSNCNTPNGTATVTTDGDQILWSTGSTSATITGLSGGTYTVTVTNTTTGCTNTCSSIVTTSATLPSAQCSSTNNSNCISQNGTATVTTNGDQILWSTGSTSATITGLSGGTYTVTVTNTTTGCTNTCSSIVTSSTPPPTVFCTKVDNSNCTSPNGSATANATGVTFLWSNGGTTATINGLSSGTYSVTVTSTTSSCTNTCSTSINNSISPPIVNCSATQLTCANQNGGIATATGSGGTGTYSYLWSTGGNGSSINNLSAGTYSVTLTDGNNCTSMCSVVINPPTGCCMINALNDIIGNCDNKGTLTNANDDEFSFTLNPSGTYLGATYTVMGLPNSPQIGTYGNPTSFGPYLISAGVMNITVTDNTTSSCSTTATVTPPPSCSVCNVNPPVLTVNDNICPNRTGSINVIQDCGVGTTLQYSTNNGISWTFIKPLYSTSPLTIIARCVNNTDSSCKSTNSIYNTSPKSCTSNVNKCNIIANATINPCNDNISIDDATDDYFTIQINASVTNGGSSNRYELAIGANPSTGIGGNVLNSGGTTYGSPVTVGNTKIFKADGVTSYQLIIRDINNNNCFQNIQIDPVNSCSNTPPISPCYPVPCVPINIIKN